MKIADLLKLADDELRNFSPPNPLVSSARARDHLRALSARGVGRHTVAAVSDVGDSILWGIITGLRPNCRLSTEQRILAVTEESIADGALVSATETRRLIRELVAEGFRKTRIAKLLGSTARAARGCWRRAASWLGASVRVRTPPHHRR